MNKLKESQLLLQEHSQIKVTLLKKYIESYLNVLGRSQYYNEIHIYDLFCGEGIYPDNGKGSPIILIDSIKSVKESSDNEMLKSTRIMCHFNDNDSSKIEKVKKYWEDNKSQYSSINEINFSSEDYADWVPKLRERLTTLNKAAKAFVFIDPYQYSGISIKDLKNLMSAKNCEILLWLPTQFMFRFEENATPKALKDFIEEMVPMNEWPISETGLEFADNLKEHFKKVMCEGGNNYFVDSFVIEKAKGEFFCLFFFTHHIYGYEKMIEAKWDIDKSDGRGWNPPDYSKAKIQYNIFETAEITPSTNIFGDKLKEYLVEGRTNCELYEFSLRSSHMVKHCNEILKQWELNKQLIVEDLTDENRRLGSYFINFTHYKSNLNKIKIKFKQN
jgi:three-Cys-motif partner protein